MAEVRPEASASRALQKKKKKKEEEDLRSSLMMAGYCQNM
jgi:hypothetical protein